MTWTIAAGRMKAKREHRVPLSDRAVVILRQAHHADARPETFIFPGGVAGRGLSNMAMDAVLKRMAYKNGNATVHGFRSTFRDWAAERAVFPDGLVEAALAHINGFKTEAAYKRTDLFEKRRKLMAVWAAYCNGGEVVQFPAAVEPAPPRVARQ